jgi:CheY-like chemotaxis protein
MVINSEAAFLLAVQMLLEDEGYRVSIASYDDGDPFPQIIAAEPALTILDIVHGDPAGWNLLASLDSDERTNAIPLIATSTDQAVLDAVRREPAAARMRTFLLKPLDLEQLIFNVGDMLRPA